MRLNALLSPLPALQALSQAAAGSDWQQHRHFVNAAQAHRRAMQRFLHDDFITNAKGSAFDYRADPALWSQALAWHSDWPKLGASASPVVPAAGVLALWLAVVAVMALAVARRLVRQGDG